MANFKPSPLSFALLSVESHNQDTGDKDLERAFQSLNLKQRLAAIQTAVGSNDAKLAFLPGAGAVYMAGCKYAVVEDRWMAIFTGEIENYSYLVKKYCLAEAGLDPQGQYLLETVRALSPLNDAQVVALLFKKLGPTFMSKLRGTFTFAVYDSNVGRVLAANDCNGSGSLWQGHVDDCLVVACNMEVPTIQVVERTPIAAGEYKFGWRAAPIAYMASQQAVQSRCNEAMQAAMAALASASGPLPSSTSGPIPTPSTPIPALNRRFSKTMPRSSMQGPSRMSLSGGASSVSSTGPWHTPGNVPPSPSSSQTGRGSYVPPHRRSHQFGSSHAPYAPSAGKRGLSRNSTSSASGATWRRSTSDATCRPPPKMNFRASSTHPLRRPSAPGARPTVVEDGPEAIKSGTSVPTNGNSLRDAILLAGDDDEEDYVATTMDSWRLAASSMLFQPAKVGHHSQPTPGRATPPQPTEDPVVQDMDMADTFLSCRSNPIPIRHSRDGRPSVDHPTGELAVGSTLAGDGPILVDKKEIQSSLESVLCSSNSSVTAQPRIAPLEKPSSMTFPWCESESSFGNGLAYEHARLDIKSALPQIEAANDVSLNTTTYDASALHNHSSPVYMPAASSPECLEAKRLLDLATQWADGVNTTTQPSMNEGHISDGTGAATPQPLADSNSAVPNAQRPVAEGASAAPGAVQAQAPKMTSSGSFTDALALLLRARSSKTGVPGSPTEAAPRSGLSRCTLATAFVPSNQASQEAVCDAPVEPNAQQEGLNGSQKLPELDDPLRSVNAGVAWQFGDRIIPSDLLQELAGGKDALAEEQAALASLVYSSPCAVCIVDVRDKHHPIVHVNLLFERQTGYTAEEVLGQNCRFLQMKPGGKRNPSVTSIAIYRAVQAGRSYCGKILNYHKDGTPLWNQLSLVPVRGTKSLKVSHYIGMQSFTKAEPHVAAATAQPAALMRGSSYQCLMNLDNEMGSLKMGKKSSSHMQLSALNLELASTANLPLCGARSMLMS